MEFTSLILPLTGNVCRTCLMKFDTSLFTNLQDLVEHEMDKIKLIDILVFLNCLENNDAGNWPQSICVSCVSSALVAYDFKLNCLKANATLSQVLTVQSSPSLHRNDIDINVVYQDHEYDTPLFNNHPPLDFEPTRSNNKELTPLPPVTEITSTEQPPRKEGDKKYSCSICTNSYTRISSLKYHMLKHSDNKGYLCFKCGKRFYTSQEMQQHLGSHNDAAQFKCGFCNKTFKVRQSLKEHFRVAHSSNRKLFVCVKCDKNFTAKSTLKMHMKSHTGIKEFPCPDCPKSYTRASYLRAHRTVHEGIPRPRRFECSHKGCGRGFVTKYSLSIHIAHAHITERPHKCEICLKGFATTEGLKTHRQSHSDLNACCDICSKKFPTRATLRRHIKTHDAKKDAIIMESVDDNNFFDHEYDTNVL